MAIEINRCFFFFQAEDGIRDGHVTGVQTCALPISRSSDCPAPPRRRGSSGHRDRDRKSTRLNSSHVAISYAVFCLKKKKTEDSATYEYHSNVVAETWSMSRVEN